MGLGQYFRCWVSVGLVAKERKGRIEDVPEGLVGVVEVRGEGEGVIGVQPAVVVMAAGAGGTRGYLCVGECGHDALGTGHVRGINGE